MISSRDLSTARTDFEKLLIFFEIAPADVARLLGVPIQTVYAWCAGRRRVPRFHETVTKLMLRYADEKGMLYDEEAQDET